MAIGLRFSCARSRLHASDCPITSPLIVDTDAKIYLKRRGLDGIGTQALAAEPTRRYLFILFLNGDFQVKETASS
jgi:hypothetical protein